MLAANEGAGSDYSFGLDIKLPFEQKPNSVLDGSSRHFMLQNLFTRKVAFLRQSDAVILIPGGFGTPDEALETITLIHTGKMYCIPVIMCDEPGCQYWQRWQTFVKNELLTGAYINEGDLDILEYCENEDCAVEHIERYYRTLPQTVLYRRYLGARISDSNKV